MKQKLVSVYDNGRLVGEPVVFIEKGGRTSAALAHVPEKILRLYNPVSGEELGEEDFYREGNTLVLKGGKGKRLKSEWLRAKNLPHGIKHLGGEYGIDNILLMDAAQLASFQYRADYIAPRPAFPETAYFSKALAPLREKAGRGGKIKILLYGDSISNAANSSGEAGVPPFERPWYERAVEGMRAFFENGNITLVNNSRSGYGSEWGAENAFEKVEDADLLIVAFGMNDGSENLPCGKFAEKIEKILSERKNPGCSAILVSSVLPHPESELYRLSLRKEYGAALKGICKEKSCAFMDMLAVSEYYLKRKNYCEVSGNNFNHPNDFMYRFYADTLEYLLTGKEN